MYKYVYLALTFDLENEVENRLQIASWLLNPDCRISKFSSKPWKFNSFCRSEWNGCSMEWCSEFTWLKPTSPFLMPYALFKNMKRYCLLNMFLLMYSLLFPRSSPSVTSWSVCGLTQTGLWHQVWFSAKKGSSEMVSGIFCSETWRWNTVRVQNWFGKRNLKFDDCSILNPHSLKEQLTQI